MEIKIIL